MLKKTNIKAIRENLALLLIAALVGTIVSFVAQLFIISVKNIYEFILVFKLLSKIILLGEN